MGDLANDTTVEQVDAHRYRAAYSQEWEIWGPMGGYAASVAMRAVGAAVPGNRPASFACMYLGVASFDTVDIDVTPVKVGRTIAFHRVSITQQGKPIIDAFVTSVAADAPTDHALEHRDGDPPAIGPPLDYPTVAERFGDDVPPRPPFKFWNNVEQRPAVWRDQWPPSEPMPPRWQCWCRMTPTATYDDPWVDACRAVILIDVQSWPAAHPPHAYKQLPVYAPSVDLYVAFHEPNPWDEWLLTDGHSATAVGGLMGWTGRLWEPSGRLVASGTGQLICRPAR